MRKLMCIAVAIQLCFVQVMPAVAQDCCDGSPHIVSVSPDPVEVCPGRTATVTLQTEDDGWTPEGDFSQKVSVESPSVKMSWSKECWISEDEKEVCDPISDSHNVTVIEVDAECEGFRDWEPAGGGGFSFCGDCSNAYDLYTRTLGNCVNMHCFDAECTESYYPIEKKLFKKCAGELKAPSDYVVECVAVCAVVCAPTLGSGWGYAICLAACIPPCICGLRALDCKDCVLDESRPPKYTHYANGCEG